MNDTISDGKGSPNKKTRKQKRQKRVFTVKKPKRKEFSCEICSKQFYRNYHVKIHLQTHFKGYGLTKQDFASMPLKVLAMQYKPIVKPDVYQCATCSKVYNNSRNLRNHSVCHSNLKPYCCEICSEAFKRRVYLRRHFATYHPDYARNYRDYSYVDETNVEDTASKKFQCDICSKGFGCKDSIKLHLYTHVNLKPYECQICSKGFRSGPQLRKHLRKHVDIDNGNTTSTTQLTVCKQEVDIDERGSVKIFDIDIRPSRVVLRRMDWH